MLMTQQQLHAQRGVRSRTQRKGSGHRQHQGHTGNPMVQLRGTINFPILSGAIVDSQQPEQQVFEGAGPPEETPLADILADHYNYGASAFFWEAEGTMQEGQQPEGASEAAPMEQDIVFLQPPPQLRSIYRGPGLPQQALAAAAWARHAPLTPAAAAEVAAEAAEAAVVCNALPFMARQPRELLQRMAQLPALRQRLGQLSPALQVALMDHPHLVRVLLTLVLHLGHTTSQQQEAAVLLLGTLRHVPWSQLLGGELLGQVQARLVKDNSWQALVEVRGWVAQQVRLAPQ